MLFVTQIKIFKFNDVFFFDYQTAIHLANRWGRYRVMSSITFFSSFFSALRFSWRLSFTTGAHLQIGLFFSLLYCSKLVSFDRKLLMQLSYQGVFSSDIVIDHKRLIEFENKNLSIISFSLFPISNELDLFFNEKIEKTSSLALLEFNNRVRQWHLKKDTLLKWYDCSHLLSCFRWFKVKSRKLSIDWFFL